jgi:hypothetical protein
MNAWKIVYYDFGILLDHRILVDAPICSFDEQTIDVNSINRRLLNSMI